MTSEKEKQEMNETAARAARMLEKERPALWRQCYPRRYQYSESEYTSPRHMALMLASSVIWVEKDKDIASMTTRHVAIAACRMFDFDLPTLFVDREFLAAVAATDLPADLEWPDVKLPYPAGLLYLPKGMLIDPDGDSIVTLGWLRMYPGDSIMVGKTRQFDCQEHTLTFFAVCGEGERVYSTSIQADVSRQIIAPIKQPQEIVSPFDLPLTGDDRQLLDQLSGLAFALLLAPTIRKDLITPGAPIVAKPGRMQRATWTPNYLGRGYTARRTTSTAAEKGTHASPRMHWRRGHFRMVHCGPLKAETRLAWIEPTLVNSQGDNDR